MLAPSAVAVLTCILYQVINYFLLFSFVVDDLSLGTVMLKFGSVLGNVFVERNFLTFHYIKATVLKQIFWI